MTEKLGFSRQKIWRIIKRLEDNKTIWGYTAVINDDKLEKKRFIMIIKKSIKPMDNLVDKIVELTMQRKGKEIGIQIEYSMFLHGEYDWMFVFLAEDMRAVKRFSQVLSQEYGDIISDIKIMENVFPVQKNGIVNPNVEKLKEFFI
jgi:DNA-binding Lrp family transcriptional regulator